MNRVKKEFRKKGIRLECDYPTLPYYLKGKSCFEPGYIFVDGVTVDSKTATVKRFLNIIVEKYTLQRNGDIKKDYE